MLALSEVGADCYQRVAFTQGLLTPTAGSTLLVEAEFAALGAAEGSGPPTLKPRPQPGLEEIIHC